MNIDIEKTLNYLRDNAEELAIAKGQMIYLQEFRKSKKAILMIEAESNGITVAGKRESYAYAHSEYQDLLEGLEVAVVSYEKLRNLQVAGQARVDVWRSLNSNQRKEFTNYGC